MSAVELGFWLAALVLASICLPTVVWLIWSGRARSNWMLLTAIPPGVSLVLLGELYSAHYYSIAQSGGWLRTALLPLAAFIAALQVTFLQYLRQRDLRRQIAGSGPVRGSRGYLAFAGWHATLLVATIASFFYVAVPASIEEFSSDSWTTITEDASFIFTDRGNPVATYRLVVPGPEATSDRVLDAPTKSFPNSLIRRATPDTTTNCHGWVFTNGQHLLRGDGVEIILRDHAYREVGQPQVGDIIIYRDALNRIVHTGLVRVADPDGLILIESKWGIGSRFLHRPEDQVYSNAFKYYRTSRGSHVMAGLKTNGQGTTTASQSRGPAYGPAPAG